MDDLPDVGGLLLVVQPHFRCERSHDQPGNPTALGRSRTAIDGAVSGGNQSLAGSQLSKSNAAKKVIPTGP